MFKYHQIKERQGRGGQAKLLQYEIGGSAETPKSDYVIYG